MTYKIKPIFLGSTVIDKSECLLNATLGEKIETVYSCFALQDDLGEVILVDTGLMSQSEIRRRSLPFRQMDNAPDFLEALNRADIDFTKIRRCILTHLHYDHSCNLRLLPALREIYVQKTEVLYALSPEEVDYYYYMIRPDCGRCEWLDGIGKFVYTDGDAHITDGLEVILTPGHSPGSQCVVVDTKDGKYILTGDTISVLESFENCVPNRICHDVNAWKESHRKIKSYHAKLLPSHDSVIFSKKVYG